MRRRDEGKAGTPCADSFRAFFALPLPPELRAVLGELQAALRLRGLRASWPPPENLHLTLAFLGQVEERRVPELEAAARRAAREPFTLRTGELGAFPRLGAARVLWVGLEAEAALEDLAERLRAELRGLGCGFDGKPFRAHLTLARMKVPADVSGAGLEEMRPAAEGFEVREILLLESVQGVGGVSYRERVRVGMGTEE